MKARGTFLSWKMRIAIRGLLDRTLKILAGGSFLVMVALTCFQVFTRYLLKNPSTWSEELVSYLFAWMSLFGAAIITGERGHMNIPLLWERSPKAGKIVLGCFGEGTAFLFSAVILLYGGLRISRLAMGQMTSSLGVAVGVFYLALPLCGVLNMLYTVLNIMDIVDEPRKTWEESYRRDSHQGRPNREKSGPEKGQEGN